MSRAQTPHTAGLKAFIIFTGFIPSATDRVPIPLSSAEPWKGVHEGKIRLLKQRETGASVYSLERPQVEHSAISCVGSLTKKRSVEAEAKAEAEAGSQIS